MHKKRKSEKNKVKESMDETGASNVSNYDMSINDDNDTTVSREDTACDKSDKFKNDDNLKRSKKTMKRELSKQKSERRKRTKISSLNCPTNFDSKDSGSKKETSLEKSHSSNGRNLDSLEKRSPLDKSQSTNTRNTLLNQNIQQSSQFLHDSQASICFKPTSSSSPFKNIFPNKENVNVKKKLFAREIESDLENQQYEKYHHEQLSEEINHKIVMAKQNKTATSAEKVVKEGERKDKLNLSSSTIQSSLLTNIQLRSGYKEVPSLVSVSPAVQCQFTNIETYRRNSNDELESKANEESQLAVPPCLQLQFLSSKDELCDSTIVDVVPHDEQMSCIEDDIKELSITEDTNILPRSDHSTDHLLNFPDAISTSEDLTSDDLAGICRNTVQNIATEVKIEDIVREGSYDLICFVTKKIKVDGGCVLRIVDGTETSLYSLSWVEDTQSTPGVNRGFLDVRITNEVLLKQLNSISIGTYLKLQGVQCKLFQKFDPDGKIMTFYNTQNVNIPGYEFIFENQNGIEIIRVGDHRVETIRERVMQLSRKLEEIHYSIQDEVGYRKIHFDNMEEAIEFYNKNTNIFDALGILKLQKNTIYGPSEAIKTLLARAEEARQKQNTLIRISGEELVQIFKNKIEIAEILKVANGYVSNVTEEIASSNMDASSGSRESERIKNLLLGIIKNVEELDLSEEIKVRTSPNCVEIVDSVFSRSEISIYSPQSEEPKLEVVKLYYAEISIPAYLTIKTDDEPTEICSQDSVTLAILN